MCPTAVDTHHSNRLSPDISVLFSILIAASLPLSPDFAGPDHYSCRSYSPREQFIPPLQKDTFPHHHFAQRATLVPRWSCASEWCDEEISRFCCKGVWQWRCGLLYQIQSVRVRDRAATCGFTVVKLPSCILKVFYDNKQWEKQHEWKYRVCVHLLLFLPAATSLHKAPARTSFFLLFHFLAVLILNSFSALSPGM